ncbi:MAG: UbiA family prenyltransferase [Halobacteriota archaeon]
MFAGTGRGGGEAMVKRLAKLAKFIELPRPPLLVVPAALGTCGVFLSCADSNFIALILGALIPGLAWAGGLVFNDYFDIKSDIIRYPERPIASGTISKREAIVYGLLFYTVCLILAFLVNIYCLLVSSIGVIIGTIYSYLGYLKREGILRNSCFGLSAALCILVGSIIGGNISSLAITVTIIGMLIYTSDNIIGRFPDIEVDRSMGARTLPIQIGSKPAAMVAFLLTISAVCIIMFLWLLGLHISYLPTASIAGMSLIWSSFAVFIDPERFGIDESIIFFRYMSQLLLYMSFIIGVEG